MPCHESHVDLCKLALPRIRPDPSQHLLSKYGFSALHAKVARTDPVTHEKVNKLRKSYEGQIKNFQLAGKNKPVKDEIPEGQWSSLNLMMMEPEESWYASKVMGKKIEVTSDLESRLQKAMFLQPGRTKDDEYWSDLLLHEKPRPAPAQETTGKRAPPSSFQRPQLNGNGGRSTPLASGEAARPRRDKKKRSYTDNSFEGYEEGFVDDDAVDLDQAFLSNSEDGSHGPGRKRLKKVSDSIIFVMAWNGTDQVFQEHNLSNAAVMFGAASNYGVGGWNGGKR
jgi:Rox3 mediator complex subunit